MTRRNESQKGGGGGGGVLFFCLVWDQHTERFLAGGDQFRLELSGYRPALLRQLIPWLHIQGPKAHFIRSPYSRLLRKLSMGNGACLYTQKAAETLV